MKPPRFAYHDPGDLADALALLARYGDDAKVLAGGQSLVPLMNMRLARPTVLVDINRIGALSYIREENGVLAVGALTRQRMLERSDLVRERCPILADATQWIGHVQTRNRGTVGGSLAHNGQAAELVTVAALLGAEMVLQSRDGRRVVAAADFFVSYLTTSIKSDEMLTEVRFPIPAVGGGWAFSEISRRQGDFALLSAAANLRLDDRGHLAGVRVVLGGAGGAPVRARTVEAALEDRPPSDQAVAAASELASHGLEPDSDLHASAEFRKHLARVVTRRTLGEALTRATGGKAA